MVIAESVRYELDYRDLTITDVNRPQGSTRSLHPFGKAFDVRTRDIPTTEAKEQFKKDLKAKLGPQFDVVLEDTHIHIEFDPKP